MSQDKIVGVKRVISRVFKSPRNLCLFYLMCVGILRVGWLLKDPFRFKNELTRLEDRLLYETVYPLIYGLYSSILLV